MNMQKVTGSIPVTDLLFAQLNFLTMGAVHAYFIKVRIKGKAFIIYTFDYHIPKSRENS